MIPASLRRPAAAAALCALALSCPAAGQDGRPVAFVNAHVLTMAGKPIEGGTVLVRNGKIAEVGKDITIPAGTRVIDAEGHTIMPGIVSAWSQAGLGGRTSSRGPTVRFGRGRMRPSRGRSSSRRAANNAAKKVSDQLYARQDVFGELLAAGVTTIGLMPAGSGFAGTAAILDPSGADRASLVADDDALLVVGMANDAATKKILKETLEKAKKVVEERNKPPEPEKKPEPKPEDGKGDKGEGKDGEKPAGDKPEEKKPDGDKPKPDQPKPDGPKPQDPEKPKTPNKKPEDDKKDEAKKTPPKREKPKDPNLEAVADLLEKKTRAFVALSSAAEVTHFVDAVGDDFEVPMTVVATRIDTSGGHFDLVLDRLAKWESTVLMPPSLSTIPRTRFAKNAAQDLHAKGIKVGFIVGDNAQTVRGLFFRLMDLVRHGLDRDAALAGITAVPAQALGVDDEVGTIEAGKAANLLVFDGDPLSPTTRLASVWIEGQMVDGDPN